MSSGIGVREWVIAEGYIPRESHGKQPEMTSHETVCVLNATDQDAHVEITIYHKDREPVGPYRVTVPARRTRHIRFNDLADPEPIARGTDFSSVIRSDVPIVAQHTRLDSRQADFAQHHRLPERCVARSNPSLRQVRAESVNQPSDIPRPSISRALRGAR